MTVNNQSCVIESFHTVLHVGKNTKFRILDLSLTSGEVETGVPKVMGPLARAKISPGIATSTNFQLRLKMLNCLIIYFDRSLASKFKNRND